MKVSQEARDLLNASIALREDMLMRARLNAHRHGGEIVVEAGNGVWFRFNEAIRQMKGEG